MKKIIIMTVFFCGVVSAQTVKKIDTIRNNDETSIILDAENLVEIKTPIKLEDGSIFSEIPTPGNPTSGDMKFYPKSDGNFYKLDSLGNESQLGGGTEMTSKANLIGFDGVETKECELTGSNGDFLKRDLTAECGWDFSTLPDGTLQGGYDVSTQPQIVLDATNLGLQIRDALVPIADKFFEVLSNDGLTEYFSIDAVWAYLQGEPIITVPSGASDGEFIVVDSTVSDKGYTTSSSIQGKFSQVSDEVSYTPVNTQGFGTISNNNLKWMRVGSNLILSGTFNGGTVTGLEAQIELPNGYQVSASVTSLRACGVYFRNASSGSGDSGGSVLITAGDTHVNFSKTSVFSNSTGTSPLSPAIASDVYVTGEKISIVNCNIPIEGWTNGLDGVVERKTLDATTANELSAVIANNGTISSSDHNWLQSCVRLSAGYYECSFASGLFTTIPSCTVTGELSNDTNRSGLLDTVGLTTIKWRAFTTSTTTSADVSKSHISCKKQGADVNKNIIQAATLQGINSTDLVVVEARGTTGGTASTSTPIVFTETKDVQGVWDGATLTAPVSGVFKLDGISYFDSSSSRLVSLYKSTDDGVTYTEFQEGLPSSDQRVSVDFTVSLDKGDKVQLRPNVLSTVESGHSDRHYLTITQSADKEAIVQNQSKSADRCQTKYLDENFTTNSSYISELRFNNLNVSKYYKLFFQTRFVTDTATSVNVEIFNATNLQNNSVGKVTQSTNAGTNIAQTMSNSYLFNAVETGLSFYYTESGSNQRIEGNGTKSETWATLCELGNTISTTEFN